MVKVGDYELPDNLFYTDKHTWAKKEGDIIKVGVDSIGISLAGKIIFVRTKKAGKTIEQGKNFGTAEAGKGVIPLASPISGEIVTVNENASGRNVKSVNEDPYGEGWILTLKPTGDVNAELGNLVSGDKIKTWAEEELKKI
ncbi:MAG: glycine cleavage system protein H [Candidatus Lokiarchaeota archaeon]|nr:glycine cleavage system protein H [Candidatus Lokiarchaeota archaeon]